MTKPYSGRRYLAIWLPFLAADRLAASTPSAEAVIPAVRGPGTRPWLPSGLALDFDRRSLLSLLPGPLERSTAAVVAGNPIVKESGEREQTIRPDPGCAPRTGSSPLVFVEKQRGAFRLAALSPEAAAAGLGIGMDLAGARAQLPSLDVVDQDRAADRRWLKRVADACERFTPLIALDGDDGIILDITGAAHLWGGEVALADAVRTLLARLHLRLAIAANPDAAVALARFSDDPDETALGALPIAALRLDREVETALRRAGLITIADLASRPTAPLAARFGTATVYALDRLLGRTDSRLIPIRKPAALVVERRFAEPVAHTETVLIVLDELLAEAMIELDRRGRGGRRFAARLYRSDNATFDLAVETGRPTRDCVAVARLFRERIDSLSDPLDPGFGFDQLRLSVPVLEPIALAQLGLEGGETNEDQLAELIDRLSTRLGPDRVRRFAPRNTHIPEQAAFAFSAAEPHKTENWPIPEVGEPPLRPLHLFDPPQSIRVTAEVPDGPPRQFQWRRTHHVVTRHEGPERIAGEWWRLDRRPGATRDYYRVEDERGRRFWIFRHGLYGSEAKVPQWYVHGLFA